ncbi:DoxX family protein [Rhodoferax koreense]|uniref:DoxX family protein n=1 Tax=Rhodoferax koreensis TaxID=1842727 RepID=A0A1P8K3L1_9BURK|nr:DoxX family protein [Rhodoferax koreense]APW40592.1 DoxX family protein [Rhodoferax koreense]
MLELVQEVRSVFTAPWVHWLALLFLCAAYLQGAFDKARDFPAAVAEMQHFGLSPAAPMAAAVIVMEFAASAMILANYHRWLGALALAGFTVMANFLADRFWSVPQSERVTVANSFFEHWGLAGGFLLVAWYDLGGANGG